LDKYYEVTKESKLYDDYFKWFSNYVELGNIAKDFMVAHGIESTEFYASSGSFHIVPTSRDRETFENQLCKNAGDYGLVKFKKSSSVGKDWAAKNVTVLRKPMVTFEYYNHMYSGSTRLFHDKNTNKVYFSLESKYDVEETPVGFVEMKGSEFYKVIEDI